jgi:hypothetical protein
MMSHQHGYSGSVDVFGGILESEPGDLTCHRAGRLSPW